MSIRDELLGRRKISPAPTPVETPEWADQDGAVFVAVESARTFDAYYEAAAKGNGRAVAVAMFARDAAGNRIFRDEDAAWLGDEPFLVIDRIYAAAMKINYQTPARREDLEKNS
jgi:hypothetical protein